MTYFHSVVTPVLAKPGCDKVIPLAPEFVTPQDGAEKLSLRTFFDGGSGLFDQID